MNVDLILSDLATILLEMKNLRALEGKLQTSYEQFASTAINSLDTAVPAYTNQREEPEQIRILSGDQDEEAYLDIAEDLIVIDDPDATEVIQIDVNLSDQDSDSSETNNHFNSDIDTNQVSVRVNELRDQLEEIISRIQRLSIQNEQDISEIATERERITRHKQSSATEYENMSQQERDEHQRVQAQLSANASQLSTRLRNQNEALEKWWILPQILPFFFKNQIGEVQRLNQQINSISSQIQQSNSSLAAMLEWHKSQRDDTYLRSDNEFMNLIHAHQSESQRMFHNVQAIYLVCNNQLLPEYRRLLDDWFTHVARTLQLWHPKLSDDLQPASTQSVFQNLGLRVGSLRTDDFLEEMPAVIDLIGQQKHLYIKGGTSVLRASLIQNILLRTIHAFPTGMVRLLLIDRAEQGRVLNVFATKLHEDLASGTSFDDDKLIEEEINKIREKISQINRHILVEHTDIDAYNLANPDIPAPYHFIVASNFPKGFTSHTLSMLTDILKNGPRAGVYFIASIDAEFIPTRDINPNLFVNGNYVLSITSAGMVEWNSDYLAEYLVETETNLSELQTSRLIQKISKLYEDKPIVVEYERIARQLPDQYWLSSSASGLRAPIGLTFGGKLHEVEINDQFVHCLVGGRTGMGKTVLLHDLICGLAQLYGPDELSLYLLDFKGTEFDVYAKNKLPHAKVVAVDCDPEVGLDTIKGLGLEMERRVNIFQDADVEDIRAYRQKVDKLPRILMIIDEVQTLSIKSPDLNQLKQFENELINLLRKGRALGIHVLLGTQSPSNVLGNQMLQQIAIRICLLADPSVSRLVLGETNEDASNLQKPGEAVYNAYNGATERNILIRSALLNKEKIGAIVRSLSIYANEMEIDSAKHMDYFDGRTLSKLTEHELIKESLSQLPDVTSKKIFIPLGNALGPKEDIGFSLFREKISNTIFVGGEAEEQHIMFRNALMGICVQTSIDFAEFFIIDLTYGDLPYANLLWAFRDMPHSFQFARNSEIGQNIIVSVYEILLSRKQDARTGNRAQKSIYLGIFGAENFGDLRGKDRFDKTDVRKKIEEILKDGPILGIHTILATQTLAKGEIISADEFGNRICLQMTEEDSRALLDSDAGTKLTKNRAIFRRKEWPMKKVEKFKPYLPLGEQDISTLIEKIVLRESKGADNE